MNNINQFICGIPKADLQYHIERTLSPPLRKDLCIRNNIDFPLSFEESQRIPVDYQSFVEVHFRQVEALIDEQDFYELTIDYLANSYKQNTCHVELIVTPQVHINRGINFETIINGIIRALNDSWHLFHISSSLIINILGCLPESSAVKVLSLAKPYKKFIKAVNLDLTLQGYAPATFSRVFKLAKEEGYLTLAEFGIDVTLEQVIQVINELSISRIHYASCFIGDPLLDEYLRVEKIPITLGPLSSHIQGAQNNYSDLSIKSLLNQKFCISLSSGCQKPLQGSLNDNYEAIVSAQQLDAQHIYKLAKNSFYASFLPEEQKQTCIRELEQYCLNIAVANS